MSVDQLAMIWSVVIVIIAVGLAFDGSMSENTHDAIPKKIETNIMNPAPSSIHLETDRGTYTENDIVIISGKVSKILQDTVMLLVVFDPMGETVTRSQIHMDSNGEFTKKDLPGKIIMVTKWNIYDKSPLRR